MKVPFINLKAQYQELKGPIDRGIEQVLENGSYVLGQYNRSLEKSIAELHGVKHAIGVNSGTDALRISLQACNIGPGDEVITTAFTFVSSLEIILQLGAKPVLVDIDPVTFNLDSSKVEAAVTTRTKAILPVYLFGQIADMDSLMSIAEKHGLIILEDAAQAIRSKYKGFCAGHFGKAASLSFYVTKNLGAAGDGGMILTNDDHVYKKCCSLRVHGMGRERYYYDDVGYTSRLSELQAVILQVKLTRLEEWDNRRSEIAKLYDQLLQDIDIVLPKALPGNKHTWHQYTIRSKQRNELQLFLKERGIDSMVYYPVPLHYHKPYLEYAPREKLIEADAAAKEVLSLPIHPHLSNQQVEYVASCIRQFCSVMVMAL